ncbi:hypothetical protein COO91_01884 [Nostoc flagelliforme CCNUN1]|uniref:Uncharacterized protein n=1 Tax=Nostoc flagelliforme CCNUN1 TaxID=2038116 RepID=A0A2K8SKM5_9NOSO|nr:hypothetical protein COO91_01884 [Nostoc flagelliforme CCNUN1]
MPLQLSNKPSGVAKSAGYSASPKSEKISVFTRSKRRVYTLQVHHWDRNPA